MNNLAPAAIVGGMANTGINAMVVGGSTGSLAGATGNGEEISVVRLTATVNLP